MTQTESGHADPAKVLILTPVKDCAAQLPQYIERIEALDYARASLSLGLIEGDSHDHTWSVLNGSVPRLERRCTRVTALKRDFGLKLPLSVPRWSPIYQVARRTILARARNHLLFAALRDEDWVLWIDADVVEFPSDLIYRLLETGHDIVHPHCVTAWGGPTFDRNGWSHHGTRCLDSYRGHPLVRLDSVGGTVLLIKADHHRDGLVFPPFRYGVPNAAARPVHPVWGRGEIETEGLAMMAADMGLQCWGMPDLEVRHTPD